MDAPITTVFTSNACPFTLLTPMDDSWTEVVAPASTAGYPLRESTSPPEDCGALTPIDDLWAEFMCSTPIEEHLSEPCMSYSDEDWTAFSSLHDSWPELMLPTSTEECPSAPIPWHINEDCAISSGSEESFDLSAIKNTLATRGDSVMEAATIDDQPSSSFSGAAVVTVDESSALDAEQRQSPQITAADSPTTLILDPSQDETCSSWSSLNDGADFLLNQDCNNQTSQPEPDWLTTDEKSEDNSSGREGPSLGSRMPSSLANSGRGSVRARRRGKTTNSKPKTRKPDARGDCEYFPPGAKRKHHIARKLHGSERLLGGTCLRINSIDIRFHKEFKSYSFNRLQNRWMCKTDLSSKRRDTLIMRRSAETWARSFMEVYVDVDDQRLCFRWSDLRQKWEARDFVGKEVHLEPEVLMKLVEEPLNRVWLDVKPTSC